MRAVPLVDVITAAGPGSESFLPDLSTSLQSLVLPDGWSVGWLVVADGPDAETNQARAALAGDLGADRTWANHDRYWSGASRNRALAHSAADRIVVVDADDALLPGAPALWQRAAVAAGDTWCAFGVLDWFPHAGRTAAFANGQPDGPIPAGHWLRAYERTGQHPFHPISMLWPRRMLVAAGGWAASPAAQDAAPVLVASTRWPGWWTNAATHLYRKHADQITHGGTDRAVEPVAADARRLAVQQAREHMPGGLLDGQPQTPVRVRAAGHPWVGPH